MTITALDVFGNQHEVTTDEMVWRPSVYGIVIDDGKILLSPQHDIGYDLPGGGVELHETFEEAVTREVKEELGWTFAQSVVSDVRTRFLSGNLKILQVVGYIIVFLSTIFVKKLGVSFTEGFDTHEREYAKLAKWVQLSEVDTMPQASSVDFVPYIRKAM